MNTHVLTAVNISVSDLIAFVSFLPILQIYEIKNHIQ